MRELHPGWSRGAGADGTTAAIRRCLDALAELGGLAGNEKANDETEQAQHGAENLDDKDLDEPREKSMLDVRRTNTAITTYRDGSAASARAAPLPLIPTATPQTKLHRPTVRPDQKRAYPV